MIEYKIEERFRRQVGHDSLGMTNKYYKEGYWYKQNVVGYEGMSERLCTMILDHSDVSEYARYEECMINGVTGSRSRNFLEPGETLVTLSRLYDYNYGGDLKNKVHSYANLSDRIRYVLDFVHEGTELDLYSYLGKILKFDMLTYDVDRHFNNLAVIKTQAGYREAPLFDFGGSFFSMQHIFTNEMSLEDKINKMTPQPFASSFEEQAAFFDKVKIAIDIDAIYNEIRKEPEEIRDMICHNLDKYQNEFLPIHEKTPMEVCMARAANKAPAQNKEVSLKEQER